MLLHTTRSDRARGGSQRQQAGQTERQQKTAINALQGAINGGPKHQTQHYMLKTAPTANMGPWRASLPVGVVRSWGLLVQDGVRRVQGGAGWSRKHKKGGFTPAQFFHRAGVIFLVGLAAGGLPWQTPCAAPFCLVVFSAGCHPVHGPSPRVSFPARRTSV